MNLRADKTPNISPGKPAMGWTAIDIARQAKIPRGGIRAHVQYVAPWRYLRPDEVTSYCWSRLCRRLRANAQQQSYDSQTPSENS
jgi:hypothetical protein